MEAGKQARVVVLASPSISPTLRAAIPVRLAAILLLVIPAVGIPTILLTRLLAWLFQPGLFQGTLPTISKTAAFAPGAWLFAAGMTVVALASLLVWAAVHALHRASIERLAGPSGRGRLTRLNFAAAAAGIVAGGALGALAHVTLEVDDPLHVGLSKLFFASQVMAMLLDMRLLERLRALARGQKIAPLPAHGRYALCAAIFVTAIVFLAAFLLKDAALGGYAMPIRWLYVGSESMLCMLLLCYSLTYAPAFKGALLPTLPGR